MIDRPDIDLASRRQQDAASPRDNIFVSANAGSGKTRVLVDRVSRLLLTGVPPAKILCLTYTKAAAGEMQSRLYAKLGEWSIMGDEDLQSALAKLDGDSRPRSAAGLTLARQLFAKALETPEGLKVQTIHAFCERLLRRFPVEAGIAPGYEALDDTERQVLLSNVKTQIGMRAFENPDSGLAGAITHLAGLYSNAKLDAVYARAADKSHDILDWETVGTGPLTRLLGIGDNEDSTSAKTAAWAAVPFGPIKAAADEMSRSGVTNQKTAQIIYEALVTPEPAAAFDLYMQAFFTQSGAPKKAVAASRIAEDLLGSEKHGYGREAERVFTVAERLKNIEIYQETRAVLTLATQVAKAYRSAKRFARKMDFNDQILLARGLLTYSAAREWVLYKLDGGVDHILIDEAQDTGPEQWDIIDAVSAEFNAVEGSLRSKFAVGDEKQSIYGFQGARPDLFLTRFQAQTLTDASARSVQLTMSFRSAPQVLNFVDTVFDDCGAAREIFDMPPGGDIPRHAAARTDDGRVELWPLTRAPQTDDTESAWDTTALDVPAATSSREQLAFKIASYIKEMINSGARIFDRDTQTARAVRAGDIMILVQKRSAFFDAVIRNLKFIGVPVAGADRLQLTSNIGVQDLISLGRFVALPADDLSLAEVLKSPIFGLSDDDLMLLTADPDRATLWDQLNTLQIPQRLMEARGTLRKILEFAPGLAPYEFYARTLSTLMSSPEGHAPDSILKRLYARLGVEAADPIDAFLAKALAHQRSGPPALDKFLRQMAGDGSEVKREPDARADEVRVMTVHGAKGLEAPVVILPDTTQRSAGGGSGFDLDPVDGGGFVVRPPKTGGPKKLAAGREAVERAEYQEYLRRFYVALTRAETRLIICGFETGRPGSALKENCWYDWASRAFDALGDRAATQTIQQFDDPIKVFGNAGAGAAAQETQISKTVLPEWAQMPAGADNSDRLHVTPSHLLAGRAASSPALSSPLDIAEKPASGNPFARGIAIHKLLEILPDVAADRRADVARKYLAAQDGIDEALVEHIYNEVFAVLDDARFADLFAPGSRAEVSLAGSASGLPRGVYLNAQIDRLAVSEKTVWIVDYKSNRPPPKDPKDVAQIYIAQMAAYRALARDIYPKKTVRCALLWTDSPHLMELPQGLLDSFDLRAAMSSEG